MPKVGLQVTFKYLSFLLTKMLNAHLLSHFNTLMTTPHASQVGVGDLGIDRTSVLIREVPLVAAEVGFIGARVIAGGARWSTLLHFVVLGGTMRWRRRTREAWVNASNAEFLVTEHVTDLAAQMIEKLVPRDTHRCRLTKIIVLLVVIQPR